MIFKKDFYLFTTENINGYINEMDLKNKSLLTLGSSLDQAYNALVLGADKVTVFDINVNVEMFHKIKRDLIISYPREQLYNKVISSVYTPNTENVTDYKSVYNYNLYMSSDENYDLLRDKLYHNDISFINGNIFDIKDELNNKKYDRMILSNVLQYLEMYNIDKDNFEVLKKTFLKLKDHLSDEGIIQLLYFYNTGLINGYNFDDYFDGYNLDGIIDALNEDDECFDYLEFDSGHDFKDGAVLYKKR